MTTNKQDQTRKQWLSQQFQDHGEVYLLAEMLIVIWIYLFITMI